MLYSRNPVLTYHHIAPVPENMKASPHACLYVPRQEFATQLDMLLKMGYRTVTSKEYSESLSTSKERIVWITFDDGFLNHYEAAFQELKKREMTASFFVITDTVPDHEFNDYMNLEHLREMRAAGMEIGSHTCSHAKLAKLNSKDLLSELQRSKQQLEEWLGEPIPVLCYPYGSFNQSVMAVAKASGYEIALSTIRGNANAERDRFCLKRIMIAQGRLGLRFRYSFTSLYQFLHNRKNRKRWKDSEKKP